MNFIVEAGGQKHRVRLPDVLPDGQEVPVTVGGAQYTAIWLRAPALLVLRDASGVERLLRVRSQNVARESGEADAAVALDVAAAGGVTYLQAKIRPDVAGQDARAKAAGSREQIVRSQITGKVLKVHVQPGDQVAAGQTLLVVEAMKMENRVVAAAAGTVHTVSVKDGDAVQTGKELARIAP